MISSGFWLFFLGRGGGGNGDRVLISVCFLKLGCYMGFEGFWQNEPGRLKVRA